MNICIISLNPGIDRILYLAEPTSLGGLNRVDHSLVCQGSKGANLSIMLKTLGADPHYFSFTGGEFGAICDGFTESAGVKSHLCKTKCGVRMNTKVIDTQGNYTEFNERGGKISPEELQELFDMIFDEKNLKFDLAVITGSFPQGVENSVYNLLTTKFNEQGVGVILDADGERLLEGLRAKPSLIKPNRRELGGIVGKREDELLNDEVVIEACRLVKKEYGCDIICTLDADGSLYYGDGEAVRVPAAQVEAKGFTGAGDTFLAAFIYKRFVECSEISDSMLFATAAAGAKVKKEGTELPTSEEVEEVFRTLSEIQ